MKNIGEKRISTSLIIIISYVAGIFGQYKLIVFYQTYNV